MKEIVVTGPKEGAHRRIENMWLIVVTLEDGDEALPIVYGPEGQPAPLFASDEERLEWITGIAARWARTSGKPLRLMRFHGRELVETFHPDGRRERAG